VGVNLKRTQKAIVHLLHIQTHKHIHTHAHGRTHALTHTNTTQYERAHARAQYISHKLNS